MYIVEMRYRLCNTLISTFEYKTKKEALEFAYKKNDENCMVDIRIYDDNYNLINKMP